MSIYEYGCEPCKKIKEIESSMADMDKIKIPRCPKCRKKMFRIYDSSFRLKGRGWPGKENKRYKGCEYMDTHLPRDPKHYK